MQVQQAIFTSKRGRKSQGYHLIACSPGVDEQQQMTLAQWGPSHASLVDRELTTESLNFQPVGDRRVAVSRSTYGGPEYSGRGGLQVFTQFLILTRDQLAGYDFNPLSLIQTARALGHLRLLVSTPDHMPVLELPEHPLLKLDAGKNQAHVPLNDVMRILQFEKRVAVIGLDEPTATLSRIIETAAREDRPRISFTTGLRPSVQRPFQLHFIRQADSTIYSLLASQGIDFVSAI